jgi:NAD+ synthase (glutamine-hydrolysing)
MKILLAQQNYRIADFFSNKEKIIGAIHFARRSYCDLVVFSELAVCGYPPLDFLEYHSFVSDCEKCMLEIAEQCVGITAIVGAPARNTEHNGKILLNAAWVLEDGKVKQIVGKTLLPTYDVFDEYRYFEPNRNFQLVVVNDKKIALTICEDLWDEQNQKDAPLNHSHMYRVSPMEELKKLNPDLMINIAASPFHLQQSKKRMSVLRHQAKRNQLPLVYVNCCGAQTELVFDGGSCYLSAGGETLYQAHDFHEELLVINTEQPEQIVTAAAPDEIELLHKALLCGIQDYFSKQGFTRAILGLSGGIDSALVYALAVQALGKENVLPVLMPGPFSSAHSVTDALDMVKLLQTDHHVIDISQGYETMLHALETPFGDNAFGLAEENLQARLRGLTLMALSNKKGHILLNTTNKSEMAVGYGTLYGDMCGGLSVIGDVYKTQVYALCHYLNSKNPVIPESIIQKAPSAELRPGQKDSDSLPPYEILDAILFALIEERKSTDELIQSGLPESIVKKVHKLLNGSEYKRKQAPPVIRVSSKAFGPGRRMPIVAFYG